MDASFGEMSLNVSSKPLSKIQVSVVRGVTTRHISRAFCRNSRCRRS